ncbi:MAG: sulfatase/phosphatase domain-containing protein [Acidobacteriota bacterium]
MPAVFVLLLAIFGCREASSEAPRPDVVLLTVAGWNWTPDLAGDPNVARLLDESARFDVAVASSLEGISQQAVVFSALSPHVRGAAPGFAGLRRDRRTLAESLKAAGFRTLAFAPSAPAPGLDQGFDRWNEVSPGNAEIAELVGEAFDEDARPLFAYLHLAGAGALPPLLEALAASERGRRAHLVVTATLAPSPQAARWTDSSLRIPLLVRPADRQGAGERFETPSQAIDIAPTLLSLAGAQPLPATLGRSLIPVLRAKPRTAEWVAVSESTAAADPWIAVRGDHWKIVASLADGSVEALYDLAQDPAEGDNLATRDPGLLQRATAHLEGARRRLAETRGRHARASLPSTPDVKGPIWAIPNPIERCWGADDAASGSTVVHWDAGDRRGTTQIRIGGPRGQVMATGHMQGSQPTGSWVRDGTVLSLVEVGSEREIGRTQVRIHQMPCARD